MEFLTEMANNFLAHWESLVWGCLIIVSTIIFVMGCVKFLFNKIENKLIRKVALAFTSIVLTLPATALYFVVDGINFDHYWVDCIVNAFATVIAYWLYENTGLRNFIHYIGKKVFTRISGIVVKVVLKGEGLDSKELALLKKDNDNFKQEIKERLNSDEILKKL